MALSLQGTKHLTVLASQSIATSATATSSTIDTLGYDELQIVVIRETHATGALSALTIQHCDTDVATSYANVTGYVAGTDFTASSIIGGTSNAAAQPAVFNIDLRGKKRYFRLGAVTPSVATGYVTATATLSRANATPITAANAGVTVLVQPS